MPQREWPGFVYRLLDADDRTLYIGVTGNVPQRLSKHRTMSGFWPLVAGCEVQPYESWAEAYRAEQRAIHANPGVFNGRASAS